MFSDSVGSSRHFDYLFTCLGLIINNHDPPSKKIFRHTVLNYFLGKVTNAQ